MKKALLLGAAFCMLFLSSFKPGGEWIVFASEAGHYAISLPGNSTGEFLVEGEIHMLTYNEPGAGVYLLAWRDMHSYYPANENMKKMLQESMNEAVSSLGATGLTALASESSGAEPHIDFVFNTKEYTGKGRIYIINQLQYTLITTGPLKKGATPDMDRFIGSFVHLP